MTIGERIRNLRKALGLTLDELSLKTGVNKASISSFENGKYAPSSEAIISLSKEFGVTTDYLLKGEDSIVENTANNQVRVKDNSLESVVKKEFKENGVVVNNELLSTLVLLVSETINSKNEVISIQKDYKNEVTYLYTQFNSDIINEKNEQIKIYKEVVEILNKKI